MSDCDALLAAILADREEDTPRLVYADCIEEEQPERAEFIWVQVELARIDRACPGPDLCRFKRCEYCNLCRRERELLATNVKAWSCWPTGWVMDLSPEAGFHGYRIDGADVVYDRGGTSDRPLHRIASFTRGFVSALTCTWADWRDHADAITARQPIERVKVTLGGGRTWNMLQQDKKGKWHHPIWPRIEFELPPDPA